MCCVQTFVSLPILQIKQYECQRCPATFVHRKDLGIHISAKHECIQHKCNECGKIFMYERTLTNHIKAQHLGQVHTCLSCGATYKYKSSG